MKKGIATMAIALGLFALAVEFTDVPPGHWAAEAVYDLAREGIVEGFPDGTFRGNEPLTRYQMAMMIWRLLKSGKLGGMDEEALKDLATEIEALKADVEGLKARLEALGTDPARRSQRLRKLIDRLELLVQALDKEHKTILALKDRTEDLDVRLSTLEAQVLEDRSQLEALTDLLGLINDDTIATKARVDALAKELGRYATKEEVGQALKDYARALEREVQKRLELLAADIGEVREKLEGLEEVKPVLEAVQERGGLRDLEVEAAYRVHRNGGVDFGKGNLFGASSLTAANAGHLAARATYTNWDKTFTLGARLALDGTGLGFHSVWGTDGRTAVHAGKVRPDFDAYLLHRVQDYPAPGVQLEHEGDFGFSLFGAADGALGARAGLSPLSGVDLLAAYASSPTEGMALVGAKVDVGFVKADLRAYYRPASDELGGYVEARVGEARVGEALEGDYRKFPDWNPATFLSDRLEGPFLMDQEGWRLAGRGDLLGVRAEAEVASFTLGGTAYAYRGTYAGYGAGVIRIGPFYRQALRAGTEQVEIPDGRGGTYTGGYGLRVELDGIDGLTAWGEYGEYPGVGWKANLYLDYAGTLGGFDLRGVLRYRGYRDALKAGVRAKTPPLGVWARPYAYGGLLYAKDAPGEESVLQFGLGLLPLEGLTLTTDFRRYKAVGVGDLTAAFIKDPFDPENPLIYGGGTADAELRGFGVGAAYQGFELEALLLKDAATGTPHQRFSLRYQGQF